MVNIKGTHGKSRRGGSSGGMSNMKYIATLAFLLILFIWLMTVDLEPALGLLLGKPDKTEVLCEMESGEIAMIRDVLLAPMKNKEGLLWVAHTSDIIEECALYSDDSSGYRMPPGLKFSIESNPDLQFSNLSQTSYSILEEVYCQLRDWTAEYGILQVVSGYFECPERDKSDEAAEFAFVAVFDSHSYPPRSYAFLWENQGITKPLTELVVPVSEINRLTGFGIFEDYIINKEIEEVQELQSILSVGYNFDYFELRLETANERSGG